MNKHPCPDVLSLPRRTASSAAVLAFAAAGLAFVLCLSSVFAQRPASPSDVQRADREVEREKQQLEALVRGERKKLQEEMQAKRKTALQGRRPGESGKALTPKGEDFANRPPGAVPPRPPAAVPPPIARRPLPPVVLMLKPYDQGVSIGQRFATSVVLYSERSQDFDYVNIRLAYSPECVRPLQVFDYPIRPAEGAGKPTSATILSQGQGLLTYSASFSAPRAALGEAPLLHIAWEAVGPSDRTRLSLAGRDGDGSSVYLGKTNLLASNMLFSKAMVDSQVRIRGGATGGRSTAQATFQGSAQTAHPLSESSGVGVGLYLRAPAADPKPGERFVIDVMVDNPYELAFDDLRLAIKFDPSCVQVLDWDTKNWIKTGINIFDAHAHRAFPFDILMLNEVDNQLGRIAYHMGRTSSRFMSSGSVARIRCRTLRSGAVESFALFPPNQTLSWFTDVSAGGRSLLRLSATRLSDVAAASTGVPSPRATWAKE